MVVIAVTMTGRWGRPEPRPAASTRGNPRAGRRLVVSASRMASFTAMPA